MMVDELRDIEPRKVSHFVAKERPVTARSYTTQN
jgi:hypothetical protein